MYINTNDMTSKLHFLIGQPHESQSYTRTYDGFMF